MGTNTNLPAIQVVIATISIILFTRFRRESADDHV